MQFLNKKLEEKKRHILSKSYVGEGIFTALTKQIRKCVVKLVCIMKNIYVSVFENKHFY